MHAALSMGEDLIFEKDSIAGLKGQYSPVGIFGKTFIGDVERESLYSTRRMKDSLYFGDGKFWEQAGINDTNSFTLVFACRRADSVREFMSGLKPSPASHLISSIKQKLQSISFTEAPPDSGQVEELLKESRHLAVALRKLSGNGSRDLVDLVEGNSLVVHLFNLAQEMGSPEAWVATNKSLALAIDHLDTKVRRTNPSKNVDYILGTKMAPYGSGAPIQFRKKRAKL